MWFMYNILFGIGYLCLLPKFLVRMRRRGGYRKDFGERFGRYASGKIDDGARGRLWVHAVSVGEAQLALRFVAALREKAAGRRFCLSTTTSTGHALLQEHKHPDDVLIYFPLDFPWVVRRVLRQLDPVGLVLLECELWPNMLRALHARQCPVWVINGRVSAASFAGYRKVRFFFRRASEWVNRFLVQTEQDAERLRALGVDRVRIAVMGSAKFDLAPPAKALQAQVRETVREAGLTLDEPLWVMGSTWPGEETLLLAVLRDLHKHYPSLQAILVPRHMERRAEVEAELRKSGLPYVKRSAMPLQAVPSVAPLVLLADTTGELPGYYSLADVVYIGKSMAGNHGGQNPVEPAMLGKAVVCGQHMENFPGVMQELEDAGGIRVVEDRAALCAICQAWLSQPERRAEIGRRAAEVVASRRGVLARSAAIVLSGLDGASGVDG